MSVSVAVKPTDKNYLGGVAVRMRTRQQGGGRVALENALIALGEPKPASHARRMAEWHAQHQPRYRIGDGKGNYLGSDGRGVTTCCREAWFGDERQVGNALRCFAAAAGMHPMRVIDSKLPQRAVIRQLWGSE